MGRQTLQIHRFPCLFRASDAILVPCAALPIALGEERSLAKRCVRAVKSFQALFGILLERLVGSSNVTWVQPARFRQSALVMARVLGPAKGHQTLHTQWFLRFRYDIKKHVENPMKYRTFHRRA